MKFILACLLLLSGLLVDSSEMVSEEEKPETPEYYEKKILPLLKEHCYKCHGKEKQEKGLRLDLREKALEGGESGKAIVPFEPEKSLIIEALNYKGDLQMPPEAKFDDDQINLFEEWIKAGAKWPETK